MMRDRERTRRIEMRMEIKRRIEQRSHLRQGDP